MSIQVVRSLPMRTAYQIADKAARVDFPVLIQGETGVGKEVMARYIHRRSAREKTGKFISLNCSAIPDTLVESELFGFVKGAFTGAARNKVGLFKMADGGTLFLDEIGDISPDIQVKLLRVVEYREFFPLGAVTVESSNFRLIVATNVNLQQLVRQGKFRRDLYHRINVITIRIPPLRERFEEIPDLVRALLNEMNLPEHHISLDVLDIFLRYHWPGNIRELKNVLQYAVAMMNPGETQIEVRHLPLDRFEDLNTASSLTAPSLTLKERERRFRSALIRYALAENGGDYKKVMRQLSISKDMIYRSLNGEISSSPATVQFV